MPFANLVSFLFLVLLFQHFSLHKHAKVVTCRRIPMTTTTSHSGTVKQDATSIK